jgi:hypothetical protein
VALIVEAGDSAEATWNGMGATRVWPAPVKSVCRNVAPGLDGADFRIPINPVVSMGRRNTSSKFHVQEFQKLNSLPRTDSTKPYSV